MSARASLSGLPHVAALLSSGPYRSMLSRLLADVAGQPAAELSVVPGVFVDRTLSVLRKSTPPAVDELSAMLRRAASLFAEGRPDGLSFEEYARLTSRVGGLPITVVRAGAVSVVDRVGSATDTVAGSRPVFIDARSGNARPVWTRRGEVLAVNAAGNHPGTQSLWPEALALGYRVAVRPSSHEPFTASRLVNALREAGFGPERVALLPTSHNDAEALLRGADLGLVYGGEDVVRRFAGRADILLQGPGRSKVLLAGVAGRRWEEHLDTLVSSVAGHAGTGCVNATAVLVEGDATALCEALTARLAALPTLPPEDPRAVLPVRPVAAAQALAEHLGRRAARAQARSWASAAQVVADLGDGSAALRPAVHQVETPDAEVLGSELPFPCVWVAPWRPADGRRPLRGSLTVTALGIEPELAAELVADPSIANVYLDERPTHWMCTGLPHDGDLAAFLMRTKTVTGSF